MYPRHRLDGLGDAIYGVSMTLLVLDIRIPDGARVVDNAGLVVLLHGLWPHALPYIISFIVLSSGWLAGIRVAHRGDMVSPAYAQWWRWQLLLVTLMPFSAMVVARFDQAPVAVAFYATNIGLVSLCAWRKLAQIQPDSPAAHAEQRLSLIVAIVLSVGAVVLCPWLGAWALLLYTLKGIVPRLLLRYARAT